MVIQRPGWHFSGQHCSLDSDLLTQCPRAQQTHAWDSKPAVRTQLPRRPHRPFLSLQAPLSTQLTDLLRASDGHSPDAICLHPRGSLAGPRAVQWDLRVSVLLLDHAGPLPPWFISRSPFVRTSVSHPAPTASKQASLDPVKSV